ncbi:hypothetical protein HMPREF0185_02389 [Brevundimonas diminuta 470-4]|nr:hypothetical protein HMPREF0185_02389 [Brevundimonas diminuta 470-4]
MELYAHGQVLSDGAGLIDMTGAGPADIQFLQADDVGLMLGDDIGDAFHVQLAIDADAAMDVVGQKSRHEFLAWRSQRLSRFNAAVARP